MMIFGWGHCTENYYGATMADSCPNCKNDTWLQLSRRRTWFTLFFIPVIPYSTDYTLMCEVCQKGIMLNAQQLQRAKQMNELTQNLLDNIISKDKYWREAQKIEVLA